MTVPAQHIPTRTLVDPATVRQAVLAIVGCRRPTLPDADVHIIPVSGGVDSSAVALVLTALFPETRFLLVFSDTGVEAAGTYESLARIEAATGERISRVRKEEDLFEIVASFGSFLPSGQARYCTRLAKIQPYQAFLEAVRERYGADARIATYVGIRADEGERSAGDYGSASSTHFPLRDLGLSKRQVFQLLERTVGIPSFYAERSRSGCAVCIFSRRPEVIAQWHRDPETLARASRLEKLSEAESAALSALPTPVAVQLGVGRNHLQYPVPGDVLEREVLPWERLRDARRRQDRSTPDLFGLEASRRLFVAVEYTRFWDGFQWQQAFQRLATYSPTLGGLTIALKHYWKHRLDTREAMLCYSEADLCDEVHIGVFEVLVEDAANLVVAGERAYTWQSDGTPLLAIRKTTAVLENILLAAELTRLAARGAADRFDRELLERAQQRPVRAGGEVVWCGLFERPTEAALADDSDVRAAPEPCVSCSR